MEDIAFRDVFQDKFAGFTTRMWLDHCDENKTPLSITYTEEEYKKEWQIKL